MSAIHRELSDLSLVAGYLHPEQVGRVLTGHKLYRLLVEEGKIPSVLSHEEILALRKFGPGLLRNHFNAPTLTAWGSVVPWSGVGLAVPVMLLFQDDLPVNWYPITGGWSDHNPAVLFV